MKGGQKSSVNGLERFRVTPFILEKKKTLFREIQPEVGLKTADEEEMVIHQKTWNSMNVFFLYLSHVATTVIHLKSEVITMGAIYDPKILDKVFFMTSQNLKVGLARLTNSRVHVSLNIWGIWNSREVFLGLVERW